MLTTYIFDCVEKDGMYDFIGDLDCTTGVVKYKEPVKGV